MTQTYKVTSAAILALALTLGIGVQAAFAQERFDGPDGDRPRDENARPAPFRALQQRALDVRADFKAGINLSSSDSDDDQDEDSDNDPNNEERKAFRARQLDIKAELRTDKAQVRTDIQNDAQEHRAELKAQLDAAQTPEERKAILDEARHERDEMRREALEKREAFRARAEETRDELKENRAEFRLTVTTDAAKRAQGYFENILKRVANALDSFVGILERINNKITELAANGVDVTLAADAAARAEVAIDNAAIALTDARATFALALESDTPREHLEDVKAAVRTATQAVKDAHTALKDAITQLKELIRSTRVDASVEADTTVE